MSRTDHPSVNGAEPADGDPTSDGGDDRLLTVRPWWDAGLAVEGHPLDGPYVEMFWLGILGPSVICMLRRFSRGFESHPRGFRLSLPDTARAIGLSAGTGRNAPMNRTIDRACTFHLARRSAEDALDVRLHLPSLSRRQLERLPLAVRNSHDRWISTYRSAAAVRSSSEAAGSRS